MAAAAVLLYAAPHSPMAQPWPLVGGNRLLPLYDGEQAYPEMLAAIAGARSSVHLSSYIFESNTTGRAFVAARMGKALSSGGAFALGAVAFLAVYREGFETVLFYAPLFASAGGQPGATAAIAPSAATRSPNSPSTMRTSTKDCAKDLVRAVSTAGPRIASPMLVSPPPRTMACGLNTLIKLASPIPR